MKKRLDEHLFQEGSFESRTRAKAAIMEGRVTVDGSSDIKPGMQVSGKEEIHVKPEKQEYVSRGAIKISGAVKAFNIDPGGLTVLDIGASTGGFTDYLLQAGAARSIAVDVGKGQLHWKLRNDPRVTVLEGCNARNLKPGDLPCRADIAVIDVSFISLKRVLLPALDCLDVNGCVVALVKPQFEAGRANVEKGGVVRDPEVHFEVLLDLVSWVAENGMVVDAVASSPIRGPKGNVEFFIRVRRAGAHLSEEQLRSEVDKAHA